MHNFTASVRGVEVADLEHADLLYPPKELTRLYFRWARTVDPLLYQNPPFWQVIEWVNLCLMMPFSVVAMCAFWAGAPWIRVPAIVVSAFTLYSLLLCMGTTLFFNGGPPDPSMFGCIYVPYLILPMVVIVRLWPDAPFVARLPAALEGGLLFVGSTTLAVFFSYVLKWFAVYEPGLLPGHAWVAALADMARQLP
jgi:hypothetical protein